tara:strand:- start:2400 stop:2861 length:462 start_codon:yes stop_codon:yes gene_type:complete
MKFSLKDNIEHITALRKENKKIVFTNGCFDLLHVGHIRYLSKAKELGDFLIIGLNSDESVHKIKGKNRPLNNFDDRAKLLLALDMVDLVIIFDEETPKNLIKEILPDILAKGGDYSLNNIVGASTVINNGGKVKILKFHEGYSSSSYIDKIKH